MDTEVVPILRLADADVAVRWYERLGFTKQWEYRFDPDCLAFVSIACGGTHLFLSEHRGDARSGGGYSCGWTTGSTGPGTTRTRW